MAHPTVSARGVAPSHDARAEVSHRALKNRLQARFPDVRSSHLSEAMASGLGFNTHAALRTAQTGPSSWQLIFRRLDTIAFRRRLVELGYPVRPDFTFGPAPTPPTPPAYYLEWVQELRDLEKTAGSARDRATSLRAQCSREFARTFGLGHIEAKDDPRVVKRWRAGVDHGACLPGWGENFNSNKGGLVDFPGSDHSVSFYESLPVLGEELAEYQTALVSMPYVDKTGVPRDIDEAAHLAGRIGWSCTSLPEWSWYAPGMTSLILFRRKTSHQDMTRTWDRSFKKWLLQNRARLTKKAGATRRKVIVDIIDCQHLPLDLRDYEDCRERYLKEFASRLYYGRDEGMALVFERLMDAWATHADDAARTRSLNDDRALG